MQNDKEYYEELERIAKDKYLAEQPETCNVCYKEVAMYEVTSIHNGRKCKDTVCEECFNDPEYQQLIKENHSTIKLIKPDEDGK